MSFGKTSPTTTFQPQQAEQGNTSAAGQWPHGQLAHIAVHTPIQARSTESNQSLPVYSSGSPQTGVHLPQGYAKVSHVYSCQIPFEGNNSAVAKPITQSLPEESSEGQVTAKENGYSSSASPTATQAIPYSISTDHWSALDSQKQWGSLPRPQSATINVEQQVDVGTQIKLLSPQLSSGFYTSPKNSQTQVSPSNISVATSSSGIGIAMPQPLRSRQESDCSKNGVENSEQRMHTILDYDSEERSSNSQKGVLDADEATKLLLNFSQNVSSTGETPSKNTTTCSPAKTSTSENNSTSETTNTALNSNQIAESIVSDVVESLAADRAQEENSPNGAANATTGNQPARNSRTYFRAPGLEGPNVADAVDSNVRVCPICSFSCSSKFHYNSHMNTHSFHQCTICNYTSRTEGRLRKHLQDSHTWEQRLAAGIDEAPPAAPTNSTPQTPNRNPAPEQSSNFQAEGMPTSIVDMVNRAAAAANVTASSGSSTDALLRMVDTYNSQLNDNSPIGFKSIEAPNLNHMPTALDQIRALTERTNNPLASPPPNQSISSTLNGIFGVETSGFQLQEQAEGIINGAEVNLLEGDNPSAPPRRAGRPKSYKCKTCGLVTKSKEERWEHAKKHIPADKQLKCECGFVTEYKHHLEYHMRNHTGSKPFKCNILSCNYVCVNKSMLNSHMKSHTPVYQFSCQNCTYKTKYCHSLKMHLRKYNHTRTPGIFDSDSHDEDFAEGGRPESDDSTTNSLQQLAEQYNNSIGSSNEPEDPKGGMKTASEETNNHPALNSMLLQPIVTSASMQNYASQLLMRQQHFDHVSELIRAANSSAISNVIACQQCDFTASSNEDMVRHNMFAHILVNQHPQPTTLASLYHNLAQQQQQQQQQHNNPLLLSQQQPQPPAIHSTANDLIAPAPIDLAAQLQAAQQGIAFRVQDENRRQAIAAFANNIVAAVSVNNTENKNIVAGLPDHHIGNEFIAEEEHNMSPASDHQDFAAESSASPSGSKISADGGTSSGSPSSEATPGGSRKRKQSKTNRLEQISEKLQGKAPPEQKRGKSSSASLPQPIPSHANPSTMAQLNPENNQTTVGEQGSFSNLLARLNQVQDQHRQHTMPYTCQHCMMAFQDRALYQIHLGYHGYETPFKCNRCGHLSQTSLEFNLHLYESNHI